ncbi:MAG: carboxypeptidase regulatory-like domain-containing protein [Spirochaetales bacterium]|nr:carboxypeptidase regulatory-like domain-containing protein [Spirochaetales bacterium]
MKKTLLILMILLSGINLFSENVAVLVDEMLYDDPALVNSMTGYINSAQSTFTQVTITSVNHDLYQSMDPVGDMQNNSIRKIIYDLWVNEHIDGVILVGDVPLTMYQSFGLTDDIPLYYPVTLPYEDLDGTFYNDYSVGADGLRAAGGGNDHYLDSWEPVSTTNRPDIWVSIIRPRELTYSVGPVIYSKEAEAAQLNGTAVIQNNVHCSGGQSVAGVGSGPLNELIFDDIDVPDDGMYLCTLYYYSDWRTWSGMYEVNNKEGASLQFNKIASGTTVTQTIPMYLYEDGFNSIRFFMDRANWPMPEIDRIEIAPAASYAPELISELVDYFDKCTSYFNGQMVTPQRAMVYSTEEFAVYPPAPGETGTIGSQLTDIYGPGNVSFGGNDLPRGQEYLDTLSRGYKLNHFRSHSGAAESNLSNLGPRPRIDAAVGLRNNIGRGAQVSILWNCVAANYIDAPTGSMASDYMHGGIGMSAIGVTRSAGTFFLFDYYGENIDANPLRSDHLLGQAHLESKRWYYCDTNEARNFDGRTDFPIMSQVLIGSPFVLAIDDLSALPASITGQITWNDNLPIPSADVRLYKTTPAGDVFCQYAESDSTGTYVFDWLAGGDYRVEVELKNGRMSSSSNYSLSAGNDISIPGLVFSETLDVIRINEQALYSLDDFYSPDSQGRYWYHPDYDVSSWSTGKAPFNQLIPDYTDGTELSSPEYQYRIFIRKNVMIDNPVDFKLHLSFDAPVGLYINGIEVVENPYPFGTLIQPRPKGDYWNLKLDYDDLDSYLVTGENLIALKMPGTALVDITAIDIVQPAAPIYQVLDSGDVTGDFIADGIRLRHNNGYTFFQVKDDAESANSFVNFLCIESSFIEESEWFSGDINGDGLTDVLRIYPYEGEDVFEVYFSFNDHFAKGVRNWETLNKENADTTRWILVDYNNDGRIDLIKTDSLHNNVLLDLYLGAENGYISWANQSYEAESPDNVLYGDAAIWYRSGFSGNLGVDYFNAAAGNYMEFREVTTVVAGDYKLRVYYYNDWIDRTAKITINDGYSYELILPGLPSGFSHAGIQVELTQGDNTIRIEGTPWLTPIDRIEIESCSTTALTFQSLYEAESDYNSIPPSAVIEPGAGFSGGAKVSGMGTGESEGLQFNGILVPDQGVYRIRLSYDQSSGAGGYVKVDDEVSYPLHYQVKDTLSTLYIDLSLSAGQFHSLLFYSLEGNLPDLDSIEITPRTDGMLSYLTDQWRDESGVSLTDRSISKNGPTNAWDAGAASAYVLQGDGGIEFSPARDDKALAAGLSMENHDNNYNSIDYAIILNSVKRVGIYENGIQRSIGDIVYHPGDIFRIERIWNQIIYSVNGYELYRSTVYCYPEVKLMFDAGFYNTGASIENIHWINGYNIETGRNISIAHDLVRIDFTDQVDVQADAQSIGKTGGVIAWDSGAASTSAFTGNGGVSFEPGQLDKFLIGGLSVKNTDTIFNSIDYAILLTDMRRVAIYEKGVTFPIGDIVYHMGDAMTIKRQGSDIFYYIRDYLLHVSTGVVDPDTELIFDVSFYNPGGEIVNFHWLNSDALVNHSVGQVTDDYSEITWIDQAGVLGSESGLEKTAATTAWDSGAFSAAGFTGNGGIEFSPVYDDKFLIAGLSVDNPDNNFNSIDYAILLTSMKRICIYENGINHPIGDKVYHPGDTLRIERIRNEIVYSVNSYELYRSTVAIDPRAELGFDVSFYNPGGKIENFRRIKNQKVQLAEPAGAHLFNNTLIKENDPGIQKAYAFSVNSFVNNGGVEFTAMDSGAALTCGLSKKLTFTSTLPVHYGIRLNADSSLSILENGMETALAGSVYQAGDLFQVVREGTDLVYYQNQTELKRSSALIDAMDSLITACEISTEGTGICDIEWIELE